MASLDTWQGIASWETTEGRPAWAGGVPEDNRPTQHSECGNSCGTVERSSSRGIIGNREVGMMLDFGSTVSLIQERIATSLPSVK